MIKTPTRIQFLWNVEDYDMRYVVVNDNRIGEINRVPSIPKGDDGSYTLRIYGSKSIPMKSLNACDDYVRQHYCK